MAKEVELRDLAGDYNRRKDASCAVLLTVLPDS